MGKVVITKDMTSAQRLAVIKKHANRFNKKLKRQHRVRKTETSFMDKFSEGQNINQWTDAPQYAEKYYGERYRDTVSHDNDWN